MACIRRVLHGRGYNRLSLCDGSTSVMGRRQLLDLDSIKPFRKPLALDENIYKLRLDKLKQIEALGQRIYPTKYDFTQTIQQVLAEHSQKTAEQLEASRVNIRVAGRIMAIRLMGKAGFAHLQQDGQRLQIYVKKDAVGEKGFELYKLLDLGDHIGVSGYLFRTRTGELTVHVEEITFLSKDLLPLPEKWHGLQDVEARYRAILEQIPAVVFMAYLDEGIGEAYVSPQIEATLGFSQREWLEDPIRWYQQIHPDDKQRWSVEAAEMFLSGNPLRSAYRVMSRDGRVIWFQCDAKMVRRKDGRPWFIHGLGFDITGLKNTEVSLRQAKDAAEMASFLFYSLAARYAHVLHSVAEITGKRFRRCGSATS